jgi:large subunit ribosomal protein L22
MEAIAKTRHLKGSPRKARLVIDLIRGVNVSRALAILKFTDKRAADPIAKTLRSAIANATYLAEQQNIAIDPDDLWIKTCFVDMGVHKNRRRMRPAPQGRAFREQRHYCHITILVSSDESPQKAAETARKAKIDSKVKSSAEKKADTSTKAAKTSEKKDEVKETKKAKNEEAKAEEVATAATETVVETAPEVTAKEAFVEQDAKNEGEVADAKNASPQTTAVINETKPADEVLLDKDEELERQ